GDELLELLVHRRCGEHQGRRHLFQDVAVAPQKKAAELGQVVGDDVGLHAGLVPHEGDRLLPGLQADDLVEGQQVNSAQVEVGVLRGEPVQVGAADRDEGAGVRVGGG